MLSLLPGIFLEQVLEVYLLVLIHQYGFLLLEDLISFELLLFQTLLVFKDFVLIGTVQNLHWLG